MNKVATSTEARHDSSLDAMSFPRFRVLHLLLWTFWSAVCLALNHAVYAHQHNMQDAATIQQTYGLIQGIISGAMISGAIVLVSRRVRDGPPLLRHPGHWLLFATATGRSIAKLLALTLLLAGNIEYVDMMVLSALSLFSSIVFSFAVRRSRTIPWKILFTAMVFIALSRYSLFVVDRLFPFVAIPIPLYPIVVFGASLVLTVAMLILSIVELKTGRQRDWLHWTGVTTCLASSIVATLFTMWSWLENG